MDAIQLLADMLARNLDMLKGHVADFTDADMLVRPVPSANHAAWQLGHLAASETRMVAAAAPGSGVPLPAGFSERFTKETAKLNDPAAFPTKAEIIDAFSKTRAATIAWARSLQPADLEKPSPEALRNWVPTLGHMVTMIPSHVSMHLGQIQVIRRALGRPVMF